MLKKPTADEAEAYMDFAYSLALDPTRSGYPTYTDGIKTKADFLECCRYGLTHPDRLVLLYLREERVCGWIQAILEPESHYLEANIFNISEGYAAALAEFIDYCQDNYPGYRLCFGLPGENREAVDYFTACGWPCEERSYNDVLCFDDYMPLPDEEGIVRVTRENYDRFQTLHESVQGEMYWNAERIYNALNRWNIWMLEENGQAQAAIYIRDSETLMEIYGVDYRDCHFQKDAFLKLLSKALNECKQSGRKYMVFFNDDETQEDVLQMGFHCVGEYRMFASPREKGTEQCV